MAALSSDKFKKARRKYTTTVGTGGITSAGTTLPLADVTGLDTDTAVVVVVDAHDSAGVATPGLEEVIVGVVSGSSLVGCLRGKEGTTAQAHTEGAQVTMYFTETHWDDLISGVMAGHNQDGTHKAFTETAIVDAPQLATNAVTTTKIADLNVTTAKLADKAVTTAKVGMPLVCRMQYLTNATLPSSVWQQCVGPAVDYNTGFTISSGLVTVPVTGYYRVAGRATFAATGTSTWGDHLIGVGINQPSSSPNRAYPRVMIYSNFTSGMSYEDTLQLTAGDTIRFYVYSGTAQTLIGAALNTASDASWLMVEYKGPLS